MAPEFGQKLSIGDWVKWESQAQGTWLDKVGQIVAVIPANVPYWQWQQESGFDDSKFILHTDLGSTMRKEQSYLVAVPSKSGRGKRHLYWPRAWTLMKVSAPNEETNDVSQLWRDPTLARQIAQLVVTLAEATNDVLVPEQQMSDDTWTLVMQDARDMAIGALDDLAEWLLVEIEDREHLRAKLLQLQQGVQAALDLLDERIT